jgi:hypothetical protein
MDAPTTTTDVPGNAAASRPALMPLAIAAGVVLSPLAFAFGAFAAVLALPAVIPQFKQLRPFGYALFAGVGACWVLSLAGLNPWLAFVRAHALDKIEAAVGSAPAYGAFEGDPTQGTMLFRDMRLELPDGAGVITAGSVEIEAGYGFLLSTGAPVVRISGFKAELDPADGKLERYLQRKREPGGTAELYIRGGSVTLAGDETGAEITLERANATIGEESELTVIPTSAVVRLLGQSHKLGIAGGLTLRSREGALSLRTNMAFNAEGLVHGYLVGELTPGGGVLHGTLDMLDLDSLWARYRKVDRLSGLLRGRCDLSGDLTALRFDLDLEVRELKYFHTLVMGLDETRAFHLPEARLAGGLSLHDGENWTLHQLSLSSDDCTLATDPRCQAWGGGKITLDGPAGRLKGDLDVTVSRGRIAEPISWNPLNGTSPEDLAPNLIMLGNQFNALEVQWRADVTGMDVACAPLSGKAGGKLAGTFLKQADRRSGNVSTTGVLSLTDGKFEFLGASGTAEASLTFNAGLPARRAVLTGKLKGAVGDTQLYATIAGRLDLPGLQFMGVTMSPEDLGRKIYRHSASPLTASELSSRREQCTRLCGLQAAAQENPFMVLETRNPKVFFTFNPSPPGGD